jgi:hypothetical protein
MYNIYVCIYIYNNISINNKINIFIYITITGESHVTSGHLHHARWCHSLREGRRRHVHRAQRLHLPRRSEGGRLLSWQMGKKSSSYLKKRSGKSLGILIGNFDWEYIYIWICGCLGIPMLMISNPLMMAYPLIVRWHIWYLGILIGNIFGKFDNHVGMIDWLSPNDND